MTPRAIKLRSKPTTLTSKNAWFSTFILPNEINKVKLAQQTINFWSGGNVVYTIFKANAWRGLIADNFPVVLIFQKKTYKEQLLCYHLLLILKPCYNYHCIFASSRVHSEIWGKNIFCLLSVFLHIGAQLSLKNARLPPVFFLDFNSPWYDLLVSNSRYLGQKYSPYRCRRPKCNKRS